jgi:hypothetical protein
MFSCVETLLRSVSSVFFWAKTLFPEGENHVLWAESMFRAIEIGFLSG